MKNNSLFILLVFTVLLSERCASDDNQPRTIIKGIVMDAETLKRLTNERIIIRLFDSELTPPFVYANLMQDTVEVDGSGSFEYIVQKGSERVFYRTEVLRHGFTWPNYATEDPWAKYLEAGENVDYVYGVKCGYTKITLTNDVAINSDEVRIKARYEDFSFPSRDTTIVKAFDYRFQADVVLEKYSQGQLIKTETYSFFPTWSDTVEFAIGY